MRKQMTDTTMKHSMGRRLQRLALGGALAALLALGAAGVGVQGDPSQWGMVAGDPSQWGTAKGGTTTLNDPQAAGGSGTNDPMSALNFTKIEL